MLLNLSSTHYIQFLVQLTGVVKCLICDNKCPCIYLKKTVWKKLEKD